MIHDDKVLLRGLEADDLDRTWQWVNHPSVYEAVGLSVPISQDAQLEWFQALKHARDKRVLAICRFEDRQHVGNVSLDQIEEVHRTARLAIFIGDTEARGQGLGRRAVRLACSYAFDVLNLERIHVKTDAERPDLVQFYESIGFRMEGTLRSHEFYSGRRHDKAVLGLLRSDHLGHGQSPASYRPAKTRGSRPGAVDT